MPAPNDDEPIEESQAAGRYCPTCGQPIVDDLAPANSGPECPYCGEPGHMCRT